MVIIVNEIFDYALTFIWFFLTICFKLFSIKVPLALSIVLLRVFLFFRIS